MRDHLMRRRNASPACGMYLTDGAKSAKSAKAAKKVPPSPLAMSSVLGEG